MKKTNNKPVYKVGDRVKVRYGRDIVPALITEYRGALGIGGRRIYAVEIPMDPYDPETTEVSEDDIKPYDPELEPKLEKEQVINYFRNSGLVSILRSNMERSKYHPCVWLRLSPLGNVTHTFYPEFGVVGGQVVPSRALVGSKIHAEKRETVIEYVQSFGLTRQEAEKVVDKVGTAE